MVLANKTWRIQIAAHIRAHKGWTMKRKPDILLSTKFDAEKLHINLADLQDALAWEILL
jgi:hypothetical protein